ncbi:MAG: hypothetical protein AB1696_18100 [Planctomycetota bacterium]
MKRIALRLLCIAVIAMWCSAPTWCDGTKADERPAYPKANDKAAPLRIEESKALSRSLLLVPPFYSEEIITTAEGVKKITTFLLFIRVESRSPHSTK